MPSGIHQLKLDIPIEHVWSFVSDMDKWAPLVPGYTEHNIISDRQSTWKFKGDLGVIQKTVHLKIDITQWQEPTMITFDLTGLNENVKGNGYFKATAINGQETEMTGCINITAKGMMGPMINPVLKSFVPKTIKELTNAIALKMNEMEVVGT